MTHRSLRFGGVEHPRRRTGSRPFRAADAARTTIFGAMPLPLVAKGSSTLAAALSDVVRLKHSVLLHGLARRAGSWADAEDAAQEAYVRVLAARHSAPIRALDRYVWRSAMNVMIDQARDRVRQDRIARALFARQVQLAPSAEVAADVRERLGQILEAVHDLPQKYCQAFDLRIVRCLPYEAVGREMKLGTRMAKIYVARTLEYLQHRLESSRTDRRPILRTRALRSAQVPREPASASPLGDRVVPDRTAWRSRSRDHENRQTEGTQEFNTAMTPQMSATLTLTTFLTPGE